MDVYKALTSTDMRGRGSLKDLTGQRFGRLVVLRKSEGNRPNDKGRIFWECQCDCGNQVSVRAGALTSGNTKSCGCARRTHLECDGTS